MATGRAIMITESNVAGIVRGIRDGTTRIDPEGTAVRWRPEASAKSESLDASSPEALANALERIFFDPAVDGVKIVLLE